MKTTRKVMVEKEITTWKCDLCDYTTENNRGCCGSSPIMTCWICNRDCCSDCRFFFTEDWDEDYPRGFRACSDCKEEADKAWEMALDVAGRHEDIRDVTERMFAILRGYPFKWFGKRGEEKEI